MAQKAFPALLQRLKHSSLQCVSRSRRLGASGALSHYSRRLECATPDHPLTARRTRMTFRSHALATVQAGASKPSPEATAHDADRLIAPLGVK